MLARVNLVLLHGFMLSPVPSSSSRLSLRILFLSSLPPVHFCFHTEKDGPSTSFVWEKSLLTGNLVLAFLVETCHCAAASLAISAKKCALMYQCAQ